MNSIQPKTTSTRTRFDSFNTINEKPVDDISLHFFYKPHTISLLVLSIGFVIYFAFVRDTDNIENNIWTGLKVCCYFFLIISVLAFPNGPFIRPHPAVWRVVFGLSVIYLLVCLFVLFQDYKTVRNVLFWMDPSLKNFSIDLDKEYGVNCSDITVERIWSHVDVFAVGHFFGWMFKAVLIRHMGILWAISCMWEITELAFAHLLPNFIECWWDALILDVLICNGCGIWCGMFLCKKLEMREYKWVSIKDIHSTKGKIKRAMLQFTPESWTSVRWLDPKCSYMRIFALCQLVVFWQVIELNTFFIKHVFELPPSHYLVTGRLILVGVIVAPSVRQYYCYVTDTSCKRVGTQCWVFGCIMVCEALICIKHGQSLFERTQVVNLIIWMFIMFIVSVGCVIGCVLYNKYIPEYFERNPSKMKISSKMQNKNGFGVKNE
ncbi:phosphatidylserine synthase 1 homolog l(3)77CDf [Leptinotarsa decemlineata]|uniref:phosphatidylserine synthase 1 homolog l(3)77CDf n=1 Tax=Leptinotarsa decemlineata TaxID=7539 RepID=UPI000C254EF8|nr:phosphatidylserine synthase 1 [Leptinotarsa decemlineata]